MPNSIIFNDDSSYASTFSSREDFLLVLVSSSIMSAGSNHQVQMKNQKRALTILEAIGIQPEVLDAADPANDIVRDELYGMSGIREKFPQFFLVQGDRTSFFADFMELDNMNEEGTLAEWLRMEIPSVATLKRPNKKPVNANTNANTNANMIDIFNVASATKILSSMDDVSDAQQHHHHHHLRQQQQQNHECEEKEKIPTATTTQEEWSDPLLLERYEDEISALENFLNEREQQEGHQHDDDDDDDNIQEENEKTITIMNEKEERIRLEKKEMISSSKNRKRGKQRNFRNKSSPQHNIASSVVDNTMDKHQKEEQEEDVSTACIYEVPNLQSMQSLISSDDDDEVETTTAAGTSDLDLRIQPDKDIHFWLRDDSPRCTITLSNISSSHSPLAFKIKSSDNHRYMVHPSVGIVKPQTTVPITVFLLDEAKEELSSMFRKLGSTIEFQQNNDDNLSIEWCGASTDFSNQLTEDYDKDFNTLLSYWDSSSHHHRNNDCWSSEQSVLRIQINTDGKVCNNISPHHYHRRHQSLEVSPLSPSTATTATITPTSSSSPSRSHEETHHRYSNNKNRASPSSLHRNGNINSEDIPINVSMETFSTRSETEHLLEAEVERLTYKCEELAAERYIMVGQLKETSEKEERSSSSHCSGGSHGNGTIHKFQLQQTMRCGYCLKVFKSDQSTLNTPIASQSCGHSICRNCCHERLSTSRKARRRRRNKSMDSSQRLRSTIRSDLFLCVGDMNQVYSSSSDDENDDCESCPICRAPKAFRDGKLHVNESLCEVLKLLDGQKKMGEIRK